MNSFDWNKIRALEGTQAHSFEELCAQLARSESPQDARFDRKGTQDAGVECFSRLCDGGEWGWQAKCFDTLGPSQWSQLDDSVKKALEKHPAMVRYYVCVPLDRPDARITGQKSAMERWDDHVGKWQAWAQTRGMNVEFVWWGSSELIERLSKSEHIGRLFFWFGQRGFDQDWFRQHLDEAIRAAGPRYTLEIHVDLQVAKDMERFSRSGLLLEEVKSLAIGIRRAHDRLASELRSLDPSARGTDLDDLLGATNAVLGALSRLEFSPADFLPFVEISRAAEDAGTAANKVLERIRKLRREQEIPSREGRTLRGNYQEPFRDLLYSILSLQPGLQEVVEAQSR